MSPLEIVLTSVLGGLVLVAVFYLLVFNTNKENRLELFEVVNVNAIHGEIVFFGDSLTDFYPMQDFFPDHTIYNRGIAGDTTKDLLKRIKNVTVIKPKKIFLQIGTNDLGKGKTPAQVVENIQKIVLELQNDIPDLKLYIVSLYPVSHHKIWLSPVITGIRTNKKICRTNSLLKQLCEQYQIPYIDVHSHLKDKKGRLEKEYTLEGLHISGKGYAVISKILNEHVE